MNGVEQRLLLAEIQAKPFAEVYQAYTVVYERAYAEITEYYAPFPKGIEEAKTDKWPRNLTSIFDTYLKGRELCFHILFSREIPKSKIKAFEKANRTFNRASAPKKNSVWFVKNLAAAQLLLESGQWPEKGTNQERTFTVGPFSVINQTGQVPDAAVKLLQAGLALMEKSPIPSISAVLYGDVFLVGNIERKKTIAARYFPNQDHIQILLVPRFSEKYLHVMIHEFGHRYWRLKLVDARAWETHHTQVTWSHTDFVSLPKVGDVLDDVEGTPTVVAYEVSRNGRQHLKLDSGGYLDADKYSVFLQKQQKQQKFPTPYSATDLEEHFCEAFALYCLGELKEPHKSNFEAIAKVPESMVNLRLKQLIRKLVR